MGWRKDLVKREGPKRMLAAKNHPGMLQRLAFTNNNGHDKMTGGWGKEMSTAQSLQPITDIYVLRRLVTKISNRIFSIHGHDRLRLFDTILALLMVKINDELASHSRVTDLLGQNDVALENGFLSLYRWVLDHFHVSPDFQPSLNTQAIREGLEILSPYSLRPTSSGQVDIIGTFYQEIVSSTFRGSLGAYLTPKPVADLAVEICQPSGDDDILDMCCGTGTFLMSAYDYALEKGKRAPSVFAGDIQGRMGLATLLNCLTRGIFEPAIIERDALSIDLEKWHQQNPQIPREGFSLIVGNPPFAGFESSEYLPYGTRNGSQVNKVIPFIAKTVQLLRQGGRAALVIPTSVLNGEARQFTELRAYLASVVDVTEIIGLPRDAFAHTDTGIEGALLFFRRQPAKTVSRFPVFFYMVRNVGYDRRGRPVSRSDIRRTIQIWKTHDADSEYWLPGEDLVGLDRWDPLWLVQYAKKGFAIDDTSQIPLLRLCTPVKRQLKEKEIEPDTVYKYFEVRDTDIDTGKVVTVHKAKGSELVSKIRLRVPVQVGDVLLPNHRDSLVAKTARFTGRSAVLVPDEFDGCVTTNRFTVLKPLIEPKLLVFILNSPATRTQLTLQARGSASFDIRDKVLSRIFVPKVLVSDRKLQSKIMGTIQTRDELVQQLDDVNRRLAELSDKIK